ncbi:MAG: type I-G CRISPR-associated protein Csb2 [Thermoleophilaceae bacterium]
MDGLTLSIRFPFGRYAATPWYRSRREEVGNVEWPPSPWRFGRALLAVAWEHGREPDKARSTAIARRLASSLPRYSLPASGELHYTQWMPTLQFSDALTAGERLDNGHSLLDVDPDDPLIVSWPAAELGCGDLGLLDRLLARMPFLGQSVSVCDVRRVDAGEHRDDRGWARAAEPAEEPPAGADRLRLLVADPQITDDELAADTSDATLKMQPAPPGTRWVTYLVDRGGTRPVPAGRAGIAAITYRLDGPLRPPVGRLDDPPRDPGVIRRAVALAVGKATGRSAPDPGALTLFDDDLDGRAERLRLELEGELPLRSAGRLLEPVELLAVGRKELAIAAREAEVERPQGAFECALVLDSVEWDPAPAFARPESLSPGPVCFVLRSENLPPLADAITVAEVFRRRLLGVAGARFGAEAIPSRLSGREPSGARLRQDHRHAHFLVGSTDGSTVTHLMVWARNGFSEPEREAIMAVRLPALSGAGIELRLAPDHPWLGPAAIWSSALPFLPVRHPKRRRGRLIDTIEEQVALELQRRGFPEPVSVSPIEQDWRFVRTTRRARAGSKPGLGRHGVRIEFDHPVPGPIALGANSHFSMGLFSPANGSTRHARD